MLPAAWEASGLSAREFTQARGTAAHRACGSGNAPRCVGVESEQGEAEVAVGAQVCAGARMKARTKAEHGSERVIAEVVLSREVHIRVLDPAVCNFWAAPWSSKCCSSPEC